MISNMIEDRGSLIDFSKEIPRKASTVRMQCALKYSAENATVSNYTRWFTFTLTGSGIGMFIPIPTAAGLSLVTSDPFSARKIFCESTRNFDQS